MNTKLASTYNVDIDDRLKPMENGLNVTVDKKQIFDFNYPNYDLCDIAVTELTLEAQPYDAKINGNKVKGYGKCDFTNSTFPEAAWDHMSGNLFQTIINQAGRTAQSITTTLNSIALRSTKSDNKYPAKPYNLTFIKDSEVFIRAGQLFVRAKFDFFQDGKKVAKHETLSIGVERDYSDLIKSKGSVKLIGNRMVSAKTITPMQRDRLVDEQMKLKNTGTIIRFGDLAVKMGLCMQDEVEKCV